MESFIAESGQIAFAISLAQWAKDSNATAKSKGTLNNLFIKTLEFLNIDDCFYNKS